jgi:hypothetical protein
MGRILGDLEMILISIEDPQIILGRRSLLIQRRINKYLV